MKFQTNLKGWIVGIVLLALSLRVWGVNFGLPYLYHPDEPAYVRITQNIFKTGDLNPHFFNYPSLFFYIHALTYLPYYFVGKSEGTFQSPTDIPSPVTLVMGTGKTSLPSTFLLGRILTAIAGSFAIALVFSIGRQLTNNIAVGLLAALIMALSPTNVANSRFITPDTFLVFFIMLSLWGSIHIFKSGRTLHYVVTGIAIGLVGSTKYNGAMILLSFLVAHFLRCGLNGFKDRRLYLTLGLSLLTFLFTTPYALFDYSKFIHDLQFEAKHYATGHAGMEGETFNWYLTYLWRFEGPLAFFAILEILHGAHIRSKQTLLLSVFPVVYFIFINSFAVRNDRTLLPLTPFLFLLASTLMVKVFEKLSDLQFPRKVVFCSILILMVGSLVVPISQTVKMTARLTTVDSRETARIWIEDHFPDGSRIAIESYSPYVDLQTLRVKGLSRMIDHTADWYLIKGFDYMIFSEGMFGRFYKEPNRYVKEVSQYENLFRAFDMVKTFVDGGYEIRIYQTPKNNRTIFDYTNISLGSEGEFGVIESGFYSQEWNGNKPFRWTDGNARLIVPLIPEHPPKALRVELLSHWPNELKLKILLNRHELYQGQIAPGKNWSKTFSLAGLPIKKEATIEIVSDTFVPKEIFKGSPDTRTLGIIVQDIRLLETD